MNGTTIKKEDNIKDLGVVVQNHLSWDKHIQTMVKKAFNVLWFLKRTLGKAVDSSVKNIFYCSLVKPHLEYGSIIWSVAAKTNLKLIEYVQKRASKFITNNYVSDYKSRLISCNILPLSYRREIIDVKFLYKQIHTNTLSVTLGKLQFGGRRGKLFINDPDVGLLLIQNVNFETFKYIYTNRIVPLWNNVTSEIRCLELVQN